MRLCGVTPYKSLNFATFFSIDENRGANNPAIDNAMRINSVQINAPLIDVGAPNDGANNPSADKLHVNPINNEDIGIPFDAGNYFVFPLQEIAATDAHRCSKRDVAAKKTGGNRAASSNLATCWIPWETNA